MEEDRMAGHVSRREPRRKIPTGLNIWMDNVARYRRLHASDHMVLKKGSKKYNEAVEWIQLARRSLSVKHCWISWRTRNVLLKETCQLLKQ